MDLTKLSLAQFLCGGNQPSVPSSPAAFANFIAVISGSLGNKIRDLDPDYAIHHVNNLGDVALLYRGTPIGSYITDVIAIDPVHQGKGLSVPLVLEAVPNRSLPLNRTLSVEGKAALSKAWHVARGLTPNPWP
jgi:hypothetical protein